MNKPTFREQVQCPHCYTDDCVAMELLTHENTVFTLVTWCCNGHVSVLGTNHGNHLVYRMCEVE